ncbi:MAG: hypothetical protein WC809_00115 [Sinimarinibacterium sp.]|jgi:hypothetical protein
MPSVRCLVLGCAASFAAAATPATVLAQSVPAAGSPVYARVAGNSLQHLGGYAFVGYASSDDAESFDALGFNPIVHFTYQDRLLFEGELEVTAGADGETEVELEYGVVEWLFSENAFLVAGKFLSPVGNFFQQLHPAWINKLPTAPLGFGHDGAAPLTEVGLQLRGGAAVGEQARLSYAVYVGNGPELEGAEESEIEAIASEGFTRDADKKKTFGGRAAWLPLPTLEVGVSGAWGGAAVTTMDGQNVEDDPDRGYAAYGTDLWWRPLKALEFRGEYIAQQIDDEAASVAPEGGTWKAWFTQAAWRIGDAPWELALRYGEFTSPGNPDGWRQLTPGVIYYIAPQALAKLAYESNSGEVPEGMGSLDERVLLQLAFGF